MLSVSERVVRYLAAIPPAVSGDHGQDQTFSVACCTGTRLGDAGALRTHVAEDLQ